MTDSQLLEWITINTKAMVGKPVMRGTRLTDEVIQAALAYAADLIHQDILVPLPA